MSADKHRSPRVRAAYLRLASREAGLGLNVRWARGLTKPLLRMADAGLVELRRVGSDGRGGRACTHAFATDAGRAELARIDARHGTDYGSAADIDAIEPVRRDKTARRARAAGNVRTPAQAAARAARRVAAETRTAASGSRPLRPRRTPPWTTSASASSAS